MPKEQYILPDIGDPRNFVLELQRILDIIAQRLNYMDADGDDIKFNGKKITDLAVGSANSDAVRKDQIFLLADLASVILGTLNQITVTDNGNETITLSTPQDIDVNADVTFDSLKLNDLTLGSIIFAAASGLISEDNSNFFWDNVNKFLGIGTSSPDHLLHLSGAAPQINIENTGDATGARNTEIRMEFSDGDGACIKATRPSVGANTDVELKFFSGGNVSLAKICMDKDGNLKLILDNRKIYFGTGDDASIYYDGTDFNLKTDEVAASDLKITCGSAKTIELQNIVYEDIQFSISGGRVPAANFPTFSTFTTNTKEYQFDVDDFLYLNANEYAHAFKNAASWSFHLHAATDAANSSGSSQYAKFTLYVAYADTGDTWTETSVTAELEIPDGTSALEAFFLTLGTVSPSKNIGTQIKLTIERIAATGGTEYPDEIFLTQVGLHGEVNTLGSRQIGTK